jgi:serine/threonine protein kinase
LPVSMSNDAKNLIVHLLNRNPSKRLGAGPDGADEIKRHPFFSGMDFDRVARRQMPMPKPRYTLAQYKEQFKNVVCTEEQKRNIFEDYADMDSQTNK